MFEKNVIFASNLPDEKQAEGSDLRNYSVILIFLNPIYHYLILLF